MVLDVVTFNGEKELFELRYNILKDFVDEFRVVEFDKTFSGNKKPAYFEEYGLDKLDKVKYYWFDESVYNHYIDEALASPNTKGASHWTREFCQKESIKDALLDLNDDDIVFIGDCDEIWNPEILKHKSTPHIRSTKLKLKVYTYYLNNKSSEEFWGTTAVEYGDIKNDCLNHIRTNAFKINIEYGWHFTSLAHQLDRKLRDSYTKETYANDWVLSNLNDNIKNNRDFLGRDFTYKVDESEWPDYLKNNRDKYTYLLK